MSSLGLPFFSNFLNFSTTETSGSRVTLPTNLVRNTVNKHSFIQHTDFLEKVKTVNSPQKKATLSLKKGHGDKSRLMVLHSKELSNSVGHLLEFHGNPDELRLQENQQSFLFLQNLLIYKTLKTTCLKTKDKRDLKHSLVRKSKKTHFLPYDCVNLERHSQFNHYVETFLSCFYGTQMEVMPFKIKSEWQTATTLAAEIVNFLEKRVPFRRLKGNLLKQLSKIPQIRGVRITCSGRSGGKSKKAQRAKTECIKYGQTSLHVFNSPIDFAVKTAFTSFGSVGVKVWISFN
jgi:hypothetical protein